MTSNVDEGNFQLFSVTKRNKQAGSGPAEKIKKLETELLRQTKRVRDTEKSQLFINQEKISVELCHP